MASNSSVDKLKRILILGDGNFSFSLSFAKYNLGFKREDQDVSDTSKLGTEKASSCENPGSHCDSHCNKCSFKLYATSFDGKEVVNKDETTQSNIDSLNGLRHVTVLHSVDATDLRSSFDESFRLVKVIFNFPHVGGKSNIKACRLLLEKSFSSIADFIDENSQVLITLCQGQGGTPVDAGRNGYGNSWQIVSQAAKAGLFLTKIVNFESLAPPEYETAGYRGRLSNGFMKKKSLTHIFMKGPKILFPVLGNQSMQCSKSLIEAANDLYADKLESFNPFDLAWHPFSKCSLLLKQMFHIECKSDRNESGFQKEKGNGCFYAKKEGKRLVKTNDDWNPLNILLQDKWEKSTSYCSQIFVDTTSGISPYLYPVYEEITFISGTNNFSSIHDFISSLRLNFQEFFNQSFDVSWHNADAIKTSHAKYFGRVFNEPIAKYHPELVPNFLEDVKMDSWINLRPEVTISQEKDNIDFNSKTENGKQSNSLHYEQLDFDDYIMSDKELSYFDEKKQMKSFCCCFKDGSSVAHLIINGVCIGQCSTLDFARDGQVDQLHPLETSSSFIAVFRPDLVSLAILQLENIKLLWSGKEKYLSQLKEYLVFKENFLHPPTPTVLYPLCYRHDLCFWVSEVQSEDVLFAAIRYCCNDAVHSVKLLRILRHEETNLLSFCYRIIYSRCSGPLSHKETVELQNRLRLLLIDMKFDLR